MNDYVPWWRLFERWRCTHPRRRCIHGDEIIAVGFRRSQCLRCGRLLPDLLPACSVTGQPHASAWS
jgi:hypothetical protein